MPIGPSLPPHLAHLANRSTTPEAEAGPSACRPPATEVSDEEEDDYGPALPPHLAATRHSAPSPKRSSQSISARHYDEESDDDVIGPRPDAVGGVASGGERSAVQEFMEREERWAKEREEAKKPKKMEREEWMLVPPKSGPLASVDPLRKRPTQFSKKTTAPPTTHSSIWTETPLEKQQRLADEVAGIKRPEKSKRVGEGVVDEVEEGERRERDRKIREGVERVNQESRGPSLLAKHAAKKAKTQGEEEPAAIWDHSRDMGITGRLLNDQERQAKIREARNLNDRFGHSKRGAYDI